MKRELPPESAAIEALDKLEKYLRSFDMITDADDTKKMLRSLISQSLQYLTHHELKTSTHNICIDCECLFEPWHDADEHECDTCQKCSDSWSDYEEQVDYDYNHR